MAIVLDGTTGITSPAETVAGAVTAASVAVAGQFSSGSTMGFKNRIINGAMVIDQRNAGASVTPANAAYTVDRWIYYGNQASKFTAQQNAASVTPPVGFSKYLGFTSSSAYTVLTGDYFTTGQHIEGFNIADLAWGTASAATVTLSFWVRSSLTGTFGGVLSNAGSRSYPFSYTISSANTWEQKTITVAGDTSGTWGSSNSYGVTVYFGLGVGTTYSGTAGSWSGNSYFSATGATSVVGTSGATLYITGVQLEKGSTATSFDYRPYGTELQLCQRYYQTIRGGSGSGASSTTFESYIQFPTQMRGAPTATLSAAAKIEDPAVTTYTQSTSSVVVANTTTEATKVQLSNFTGLTSSRPYSFAGTLGGTLQFSAEL